MALNPSDMLDDLTMADLELLETISEVSISKMDDPNAPKAKLMIGLAFIMTRKQGAPKTLDEIRAMPITEIENIIAPTESNADENVEAPSDSFA